MAVSKSCFSPTPSVSKPKVCTSGYCAVSSCQWAFRSCPMMVLPSRMNGGSSTGRTPPHPSPVWEGAVASVFDAMSANKSPCMLPSLKRKLPPSIEAPPSSPFLERVVLCIDVSLVGCDHSPPLGGAGGRVFFKSCLNSSSSYMCCRALWSGSLISSAFISSVMGASFTIVANQWLCLMRSAFSVTFLCMAPFSLSVLFSRFSMLPHCWMRVQAVFSPTPGQPGMLSLESPISPRMSITCKGESMPHFSQISLGPMTCASLLPTGGRYMLTLSVTNWP